MMDFEITPSELEEKLNNNENVLIVDVREPDEFELVNIGGSNIPMGDIASRISELDENAYIVTVCHHGIRSAKIASYLISCGYKNIQNLKGGVDLWAEQVDPAMKRY